MYKMVSKLLNGIKIMYVNSPTCFRVKGGERKSFRIDSGVIEVYYAPLAFQYIYGCSDERGERGKGGDCPASCMHMTWFFLGSQRRSMDNGGTFC